MLMQVIIGAKLSCSCAIVDNDHCIHTLYVMLKKYKVPESNAIIWQGFLFFMQLRIWIRNWKGWSSWSICRKRRRWSANSSLGRRRKWLKTKTAKSFRFWTRIKLALSAMRIWFNNAILLVRLVKNVSIQNV